MKKLIILFFLIPFMGLSQAKFGGNSVAAARASLKNSNTYTLTYVDGIFYLVSTTSSFPIGLSSSGSTGTGNLVYSTSPTLVTPNLGTPSAVTLTNATGLPVSTGISGLGSGIATFLATPSSANLAAALTDETGTGAAVFANNSTLTGTTTTSVIANTAGANFATTSGRVGIGTSSPSTPLHVSFSTTTPQPVLTLETVGTNGRPYINFRAEGTNYGYFGWGATSGKLFLMNYNNASIDIGTNSTTRMSVDGSGNVGIGTTSPSVILDINNTGAIKIPVGTDAQRPASPATGMLRVNTTASPAKLEYYNGSSWIQL